jgi:hypothetical protein
VQGGGCSQAWAGLPCCNARLFFNTEGSQIQYGKLPPGNVFAAVFAAAVQF